jgi:photosystem I subunit PsaO
MQPAAMQLSMQRVSAPRAAVRARPAPMRRALVVRASAPYPSDWLKKDPLVLGLGFLGWTLPSTIGVPAFGGQSLFGLLTQSIGEQMAHWPTGPALSDKFW